MKLGVAYNIFDGTELLANSINGIRQSVDYICCIYQTTSNFGNGISLDLKKLLEDYRSQGLIDEFIEYNPELTQTPHQNECKKRNIGLEMCMRVGCTHYITMDVDEIYTRSEFDYAKGVISDGNYDSSACQMLTYYKTPEFILDPPEEYYVPFIYRIDGRRFREYITWPVLADPTRKLVANKIKIFDRKELQMHHLSYVRKDIHLKLENSSAKKNFAHRINEIAHHFNTWKEGDKALLAGKEKRYHNLEKVPNVFNRQ